MQISEDGQYAYHLTYSAARVFGNHEQAHRWAYYARDSWRISNAIKRGYSIRGKFLKMASLNFYEEDIHKVLVREGIEPEGDNDQIPSGPPHAQAPLNLPNGPQVQNMGKNDDDK